ncbi:hypothetical protein HK097_008240 [Rhizophlyctis rosea]|uniref:Uncharacterized protein n=1 Tax=Rhizophlyctis rosea TaxID=64517 RepID=A0AAD5SCS3_9FUNG|nr:hypothetical protein HK097_008240 [Rhizophlyctis rosea]
MSTQAQTRTDPAQLTDLHLPPELTHHISYRSAYSTARKFRATCFWLRDWCKEADLRQCLLGPRRTWIWAAFVGRVDELNRIEEEGLEGDFAYCDGKMSRWEVALRVGVVAEEKEVVEFALKRYPGPINTPADDGPLLRTALEEEPDVCRLVCEHPYLERGPAVVATDRRDSQIGFALLKHGATKSETKFALSLAIDIALYLIHHDPSLYLHAIRCTAMLDKPKFLQTLIDLRRSNMDPWNLQFAMDEAAKSGKNANIKVLLRRKNRKLQPHLHVGKGRSLSFAAKVGDPSLVPSLVECDDDIYVALRSVVAYEESKVALQTLLQWIRNQNQTCWQSNPYVVPIECLVRATIELHLGSNDDLIADFVPLLCEHFSETESVALQEDPEIEQIVRDALKGPDQGNKG